MIPKFWSVRAHILFQHEKSFLGVFCTYSPVSDFSRQNNLCIPAWLKITAYLLHRMHSIKRQNLCVRSSAENLNHIYSCKTFRFAQPGESNRISAHLWISIDSHRQQTKFTAFPSALKREIKYCALYPLWSSRTGNGSHPYLYTRHNKTRPSMFPESLVFLLSLCGWAEPICPTRTSIF